MKHLLCSALWEMTLRNPVNGDTKHLWEDEGKKQPNTKPGTHFIMQTIDVMGVQSQEMAVGDFRGGGAVYKFQGDVSVIRERSKLPDNPGRGIPKGKAEGDRIE